MAHGSRLTAHGSRLTAHGSHGERLSRGSRLSSGRRAGDGVARSSQRDAESCAAARDVARDHQPNKHPACSSLASCATRRDPVQPDPVQPDPVQPSRCSAITTRDGVSSRLNVRVTFKRCAQTHIGPNQTLVDGVAAAHHQQAGSRYRSHRTVRGPVPAFTGPGFLSGQTDMT